MLCDLLARTGTAGLPQSYFRPGSIAQFARRWGVPGGSSAQWGQEYVDAVVAHGSGGTGCFGMRIMWSDMLPVLARLHALRPCDRPDAELLRSTLGVGRFVHLSREDRVAQAVSLVLAEQTGLWHRHADGSERQRTHSPRPPRYDHDRIAAAVRLLDEEALGWSAWFDAHGIAPLTITYEALVADTPEILGRVLRHLGADVSPATTTEPSTSQIATELNDEWSTRFRRESRNGSRRQRPPSLTGSDAGPPPDGGMTGT